MSNEAQENFFDLGFQYYVAGRYAFAAKLSPVCGNLFHHAIEMFIKGCHFPDGMEKTEVESKLKELGSRKFSHKLIPLWNSFKILTNGPISSLAAFDQAIEELQKFHEIRYPDKFLKKGIVITIGMRKFPNPGFRARGADVYSLWVEDLDRLVKFIFKAASINPKYFTKPGNEHFLKYLKDNNAEMKFLGLNEN